MMIKRRSDVSKSLFVIHVCLHKSTTVL